MAGDLEICSVFHPGNFGCIPGKTYNSDGYTGDFYGLNYISHGSLLQLFSGSHGKLASSLLKSSGVNHMTLSFAYIALSQSFLGQRPTRSSLKEYYNRTISVLDFDRDIAGNLADNLLLEVWRPYRPYQ